MKTYITLLIIFMLTISCSESIIAQGLQKEIYFTTTEEVNSTESHKGQIIGLSVTAEVWYNGQIIIEKDAKAWGIIKKVKKWRAFGQGGLISIIPKSVETKNGSLSVTADGELTVRGESISKNFFLLGGILTGLVGFSAQNYTMPSGGFLLSGLIFKGDPAKIVGRDKVLSGYISLPAQEKSIPKN